MSEQVWLPSGETHVTVTDGKVRVWDSFTFQPRPVASQPPGFSQNTDEVEDE